MKELTLEERKDIMLSILIYIDQIASQHKLDYSLWGGTLLGAVRHKGFIPWDDDIDISLPRKHYDRLLSILSNDKNYTLYDFSSSDNYSSGYAKLTHKYSIDLKKDYLAPHEAHGVFVDIIPIDGLPSDKKAILKHKKNARRLQFLIKTSKFPSYASSLTRSRSTVKLIVILPIYIYTKLIGGRKKLIKELNKFSIQYTIDDSLKCGQLLTRYKTNLGYPSRLWNEFNHFEFEGHLFKGIADAETYLSLLYGEDYMILPPENKRIIHSEHQFFLKDGENNEHCNGYGERTGPENGAEHPEAIH